MISVRLFKVLKKKNSGIFFRQPETFFHYGFDFDGGVTVRLSSPNHYCQSFDYSADCHSLAGTDLRHIYLKTIKPLPKSSQSVHCFPYNGELPPFHQKQKLCQFLVLIDRLLSRQTRIFSLERVFLVR